MGRSYLGICLVRWVEGRIYRGSLTVDSTDPDAAREHHECFERRYPCHFLRCVVLELMRFVVCLEDADACVIC